MRFQDVAGHTALKERLIRSVTENRVSHAQLFLGPEGSGSLALAVAYAQFLLCTNKQGSDSCGTCPSCMKMNGLVHPDLHFVYPIALSKDTRVSTAVVEKWREAFLENPYLSLFDWVNYLEAENKQAVIGTEESGEILRKLSLTTYESEYKIMIIWMAEKMNQAAANKLLKILEEPSEKTLFLMVCQDEGALLQTIISRTQLVKVNKLNDEELIQELINRKEVREDTARKIAGLVNGNYAEALHHVNESEAMHDNFLLFSDWMRNCLKFNSKVIEQVGVFSSWSRERQKNFLLYSLNMFRNCLMLNYGDEVLVKLEGEELDFARKFSPFINGANCEGFIEEFNIAHRQIERNANPKILFQDLSFKVNELLNKKVAATA